MLLFDDHRRLLLLQVTDDSIHNRDQLVPSTFWTTLGGGLEAGEAFEDAARREVLEETGIADFALGPEIWRRQVELTFSGEPVLADERYFVGWASGAVASLDNLTDAERRVVDRHRWWPVDEVLAMGDDTIVPPEIRTLVAWALRIRRLPARPAE